MYYLAMEQENKLKKHLNLTQLLWVTVGIHTLSLIGGVFGGLIAVFGDILSVVTLIYLVRDSFKREPGTWKLWLIWFLALIIKLVAGKLVLGA